MSDEFGVVPMRFAADEAPQAADWLAKLDRGDLSAEERAAFARWLAENPNNRHALREAAAFWYGLNGPLSEFGAASRSAVSRTLSLKVLPAMAWAMFRRYRSFVIAASCAAIAAVVFLRPSASSGYFATKIGETRVVALDDGSTISLNTNSIVEQAYTGKERVVRLVSGEAIFEVAHDKSRPFIVYAMDGEIRAVGTRFSVRMEQDKVSVTVTAGRIALERRLDESVAPVAESHALERGPVMVGQGETAEIDRTGDARKEPVSTRDVSDRLSWSHGKLVFHDKDIQSVVDEITRYTTVRIVVDEKLRTKKITGILEIGDINLMLEGMEGALGVKAKWVSPSLIQLGAG